MKARFEFETDRTALPLFNDALRDIVRGMDYEQHNLFG